MSTRVDCPELREAYAQNPWPSNEEVESLAAKLGLFERQIKGWYGRCRARDGKPARDPSKPLLTRASTTNSVATSSKSSTQAQAQAPGEQLQGEPASRPRRTRQTTAPSKVRYDPYSASSSSSSSTPKSARRAVSQARSQEAPVPRPHSDRSSQPSADSGPEVVPPRLSSADELHDGISRPTSVPQLQHQHPASSAPQLPEPSERVPSFTEPSRYALQSESSSSASSSAALPSSSASLPHDMQAPRAQFPDLSSTSMPSECSFTIDPALNASLHAQAPVHDDESVEEPLNQAFGDMDFSSTNEKDGSVPTASLQQSLGLGLPSQAAPDRPASSTSVSRTASSSSSDQASQDLQYTGVMPSCFNMPQQPTAPNIDPLLTVRNAHQQYLPRQQAVPPRPHPPMAQPQHASLNFGPPSSSAQLGFGPAYTVPPSLPNFNYSSGPPSSAAPFMLPNNVQHHNTNVSNGGWAWSAGPSGATHPFPGNSNFTGNLNNNNNNNSSSSSNYRNNYTNNNTYNGYYGPPQPQPPQPGPRHSVMDPAQQAAVQQTFDQMRSLIPPGFS